MGNAVVCLLPDGVRDNNLRCKPGPGCKECGWCEAEQERRKSQGLERMENGLWGIVIRHKRGRP